jgi:Family of unknown function (DUF5343)
MAEEKKYPYTTVPTNLRKLMEKIPALGAPPKANQVWLAGIGFAGGNNKTLLTVLRHVGVIDKTGVPTNYWTALRSGDHVTFADAVRKTYPELFSTYPDAHKQDSATLQTFFRTHTGLGEKAQSFSVRTFKVLVEFGDFSKSSQTGGNAGESRKSSGGAGNAGGDGSNSAGGGSGGAGSGASPPQQPLALTVNLQIELPPSADGDVYDKLFAAMGKHLKGLITPPR